MLLEVAVAVDIPVGRLLLGQLLSVSVCLAAWRGGQGQLFGVENLCCWK